MKSVLVTGGASGIGAAICRKFSGAGYRVGVLDIDRPGAEKTAETLKNGIALHADVRDPTSVDNAFGEFGATPDVLVNNAGIVRFGSLIKQGPGGFSEVLSINLMGAFNCAWVAAQRMIERGSGVVINITSINALTPGPDAGGYPASKAALAALTQHMALEWGPLGLRVNAVAPGFIDAGMSAPIYARKEVRHSRGNAVPLRRLGTAEEVAAAVCFLASDEASYINGHQLVIDGGVVPSLLVQLPRV
jgi:NAD(P)-dependent dehydrogenase (short-subunit alcohol dehydrogenase family)